jgi:uncharacterized protein (TIGR00645 family)
MSDGLQKKGTVKLAGSLVGVSGIDLLQTFINIKNHESQHVMWQVIIHVVFLISFVINTGCFCLTQIVQQARFALRADAVCAWF